MLLSKKKELREKYDRIYKRAKSSLKTKEYKHYVSYFGVEATMEDLRVVAGYSLSEMYLFSVELFEREVKKFDLKIEGEYRERKAEMEYQEAVEKAKSKSR